jgi:DNA-binding CsgD family transcriptional regulator
MLDLLAGLIGKSLAQLRTDGAESRFVMLETVREFALERLAESGEADEAGRRHAAAIVALCERAGRFRRGPDERVWTVRFEAELGNIRAALTWGLVHDITVALRIGAALWQFWCLSGLMAEGRVWLEAALAMILGDFAGGIPLAEDALALSREACDPLGEARAVRLIGAADAVVDAHAFALLPPTRAQIARALARAEAALGPAAVAAERAVGHRLPRAEAIAMALRESVAPEGTSAMSAAGMEENHAKAPGLSPRQREVLALVVTGRSDQQIANTLFISRRTASHHVAAIMTKLGAHSRGEAAVRAVRDGLI